MTGEGIPADRGPLHGRGPRRLGRLNDEAVQRQRPRSPRPSRSAGLVRAQRRNDDDEQRRAGHFRSRRRQVAPRSELPAPALEPARRCHRLSGALIALPVAAVIRTRIRGRPRDLPRRAGVHRGAGAAIGLTLSTAVVAAMINAVLRHAAGLRAGSLPVPGPSALVSSIVDLPLAIPTLGHRRRCSSRCTDRRRRSGRRSRASGSTSSSRSSASCSRCCSSPSRSSSARCSLCSQELDEAEEEAAATLGATAWTTFRRIVLPALRPAIAAGSLLVVRAVPSVSSAASSIVSGNITGRHVHRPRVHLPAHQPVPARGGGRRRHRAVRDLVRRWFSSPRASSAPRREGRTWNERRRRTGDVAFLRRRRAPAPALVRGASLGACLLYVCASCCSVR